MQRCTSPDITEGPKLPPAEQRRPGRPKKSVPVSVDTAGPSNTPSPSENSENSPAQTQNVKRGRGRPKKSVETVVSSPIAQCSPPISSPSVATTTPTQQPKRRGRKPKAAATKENVTMEAEESMDTSFGGDVESTMIKETGTPGGDSSSTPMDTEDTDQGSSGFFSSVMKSEPLFGQVGGGGSGIPGLDLDDCDANSATMPPNETPSLFAPAAIKFPSFESSVIEECKNLQQLSLTKQDESLKTVTDVVKKEDPTNDENESSKVRRSSRIKTLEEQRGSRRGRREVVTSLSESSGLSRSNLSLHDDDSNSNSSTSMQYSGTSGYSSPMGDGNSLSNSSSAPNLTALASGNGAGKPLKVKSRWRYSLDSESKPFGDIAGDGCSVTSVSDRFTLPYSLVKRKGHLAFDGNDDELSEKLKMFEGIDESIYKTDRKISKENKGMVCDCYLSSDDVARGESGCSEDCLNRLLMVECGNRCPTGDNCSNRRFQRKEYATLEVFKTEKKGHGLRTLKSIPEGGFVIEYVGEVLNVPEFERRTTEYAKGNQEHFYFMALKSDAIIDATMRGNCSRFINHSCEPNCETQKWTVNGEVRIGFFAITDLQPGDEITFDYQFQRYGKKAQKCFCMTESCRGWIGDEEEDDAEDEEENEKEEVVREAEEVKEVKPKVKVERKKRKNVQLEDMAFREELAKLEYIGLKNRTHTLTLSRLMVRAESWDDRERLIKILINGDTPCRRLFLDYHGLRLMWSWMVDLPLPNESVEEQSIRNDVYHLLFLKALQSLPIPHKTLLVESKVWTLVEKWCSAPAVTTSIPTEKPSEVPGAIEPKKNEPEGPVQTAPEDPKHEGEVSMDTSEGKEEPTSTAEVLETKQWNFVPLAKTVLESWADLKEVFRIPKKERVEQMKEHEREADKGLVSSVLPSISSYDRDHRNKQYRSRVERRVPVLDSTQPQFHRHLPRPVIPPGVTKDEWRRRFELSVKEREEQELLRKQQDALVTLHQERCALVGLDPATTPIVDPHGVHYLDPKTVMWKPINIEDPTMPPELMKFVQLSQYPQPPDSTDPIEPEVPVEPEEAFPPWPPGLPPPPPLPPTVLPRNWKMTVDDEGRCYYYHIRTRVTRWEPPTLNDESSSESSDSSSEEEEEEVDEIVEDGSPSLNKASIQTWRTKLIERAERRKKSGLVQERIISPRADDDKGFSKEMVKENKRQALEEKLARLAMKDSRSSENPSSEEIESAKPRRPTPEVKPKVKQSKPVTVGKRSLMKKRRKERPSQPKGSSSKPKPKVKEEEVTESSSPIETELDLTLSQQNFDEEHGGEGFFSRVSSGPSRIIGSTPSMDVVMIPGLGFDNRDLDAKKKSADRAARHAAKKKEAMQKKAKAKAAAESSAAAGPSRSTPDSKKRNEESGIKDKFRNNVATVVVAHLNPFRKTSQISNNDDFKHLARKITHTIVLKELKHTRDVTSLDVTDSVKHKTKEYIKKFMARFPNEQYVRSPENPQSK